LAFAVWIVAPGHSFIGLGKGFLVSHNFNAYFS
jgi:hypothetical protein